MRFAGLVLGLRLNLVSSVMTFSFVRFTESEGNGCGGIGVSTADFASGLVLTSSLTDLCGGSNNAETSVGISDGSDADYYERFEWQDGAISSVQSSSGPRISPLRERNPRTS